MEVFINMEFFIRKNSTLPVLEVNLVKDGRLDFNYINSNLTNSTIYFSMMDVETGVYKIINGVCELNQETNSVYYQFTKKNTLRTGRYLCEFSFGTDQGIINLPLKDKLYVSVNESFSDSNFCCGVNQNVKPQPAPPGIYYGKVNSTGITSGDISLLTFVNKSSGEGYYVTQPQGNGYGYILIPNYLSQPNGFRDSTSGCFGNNVPINNIGTIKIYDTNGVLITYNIYRTFFSFGGQVNIWLCS